MSESSAFQNIDGVFLKQKIRSHSLSQKELSKKLDVDDGTLSRWIAKNAMPANLVWRLKKEISLSMEDLRNLLKTPSYKVFFRKRFVSKVPPESEKNAVNWAQTFLSLSSLHSDRKFVPTDLSSIDDPEYISEKIRDYLKFDKILSLRNMVALLRDQGIEVGFIPFSKLNIDGTANTSHKEVAFTVTDGSRYCVFLDTNPTLGSLTFHLGHEIAHIFRSNVPYSKDEEKFCNAVSSCLIYPKSYFITIHSKIKGMVGTRDVGQISDLIEQIVDDIGGEFEGVVYRLVTLGYLSSPKTSTLTRALIQLGKKKSVNSKTISEAYFKTFNPKNNDEFSIFWNSEKISSASVIFRYYDLVKRAVSRDDLSPRKLSELFLMEPNLADELAAKWRFNYQLEMKEANAENNSL